MTSKSSFWRFSIWNIKRRSWVLALSCLVWLVDFPFVTYIHIHSLLAGRTAKEIADSMVFIQFDVLSNRFAGIYHIGIIAALAILMALQSFDWINKKQKVDLYKSVPVREAVRFFYINLNSFFLFLIPYAVSLLLANLIALAYGIYNRLFAWVSLFDLCIGILIYLAVYMLALIAELLTGNTILSFFGACFLLVAEPVCRLCVSELKNVFYQTNIGDGMAAIILSNVTTPILTAVNLSIKLLDKAEYFIYGQYADSYISFRMRLLSEATGYTWIKPLLLLIVQILLYTFAAYVLYKKRPAVTGGKSIVFRWAVPVIKAAVIFVCALFAGVCMTAIGDGNELQFGLFGIVAAVFLLHIVLNVIIEGDFNEALKKTGKTLPLTLASGGIACILLLCYALDWTGFDTWLPKESDLTGFEFVRNYDSHYSDLYDSCIITDEAAKRTLLTVMQDAIENDRYCEWPERDGYGLANAKKELGIDVDLEYEDANSFENVTLTYYLKNGKIKYRRYVLSVNDTRKIYAAIYELEEYKKTENPFASDMIKNYFKDPACKMTISYASFDFENEMNDSLNAEEFENEQQMQELISTLQKDMEERSYADILKEAPIGRIEVVFTVPNEMPDTFLEAAAYNVNDRGENTVEKAYYLPVYECDEGTVELIKKAGLYRENIYKPELLSRIEVSYYDYNGDTGHEIEAFTTELSPDSDTARKLMEHAFGETAYSSYTDMSMLAKYNYFVTAYAKTGVNETFFIYKEGFPKELETLIKQEAHSDGN